MLEDLGNCVKIHDQIIPAVNIQIKSEDIFRYDQDIQMWIALYFEIMFEDGTLWEVYQKNPTDPIMVCSYPNFYRVYHEDPKTSYFEGASVLRYTSWEDFLGVYNLKLLGMELTRRIHWSEYGELCR